MSIKNANSDSATLQERLEQINFRVFFSNAEAIDTVPLRESTISRLKSVEERVKNLEGRIQKSSHLSNDFLKKHVIKTIRLIPKNVPTEALEYDDDDVQLFREIFTEVRESLKAIRNRLDEQLQKELKHERTLFAEQENLHTNELFIQQLKTFPATQNQTRPKVYIAYAWPIDDVETKKRECRVQPFLKLLENHLALIGIKAKLDVRHCSKGGSIYEYMEKKIEKSDTFLLFGTESLFRKMKAHGGVSLRDHHSGGYPLICYELGKAYKKAAKDNVKKEKSEGPSILPVLLTGNMENSFPEYFQGNFNTILLPEIGYLEGLKRIIYSVYGFQRQGIGKSAFEQVWKEHFEKKELKVILKEMESSQQPSDTERSLIRQSESKQIKELNTRIINLANEFQQQSAESNKVLEEQIAKSNREIALLDKELQKEKSKLHEQIRLTSAQAEKIVTLETGIRKSLKKTIFGKADWEKYFGNVGEEPPLPPNILEILSAPCPFWSDKLVEETHVLVLVPEKVNGTLLTLNSLSEMIQSPKQGHITKFRFYNEDVEREYGKQTSSGSRWVLMTKDILPDSKDMHYQQKFDLVSGFEGYETPEVLDTATVILMHYVKTGEKIYQNGASTYTLCRERLKNNWYTSVGGFSPDGVAFRLHNFDYIGIGGSRKF